MVNSGSKDPGQASGRPGGIWGHLLVSASACLLTVSIAGSGVFLIYKAYQRYETKSKVRAFIESLENRTPEELEDRCTQLKERPKLAEYVLPELRRTLASATSERQLCAAIEVSRAFLDNPRISRALFELRRDGRESVAGDAVRALAGLQPPEHAADVLGKCLEGAESGQVVEAVIDQVCAGLFLLGEPGLQRMRERLASLPPERRVWLVGYVNTVGGPYRVNWLELLQQDPNATVRARATAALSKSESGGSLKAMAAGRE
ncbi:MAG TPA: hypothetical protein VJZ71_10510 [Phycisphaerae bacterium]|nr:hypothetical protein [Phycisphaerae bacterium]